MKKHLWIIPVVILTILSGFFAFKWIESAKSFVLNVDTLDISTFEMLEKLPTDEVVLTYKDQTIIIESNMVKGEVSALLDEYGLSNFLTSAVLLIFDEKLPVTLTIDMIFGDEPQLILSKVKLNDFEMNTNIQIKK